MYCIIDIETTGGKFDEEGITEIAIYKYDGHEIVDQFISLVNPERPIDAYVVKLTGINNAMLRQAPKFYEIAKRVIEITENTTIVAHNSAFDYRILKTEFKRLGFGFVKETLCTVELSKKLIPDMASYSLGKLVRALGIPIADRHRARGDALATLKLFKLLLEKDVDKDILTLNIKQDAIKGLPPKLLDILEGLPSETGIYYIHNNDGKIIYIGKSKNIRKRVNQHFTSSSSKSKKIQAEVFAVTFEKTGSELLALIKESEEIKIHKPIYNRALRNTFFEYAIYLDENEHGYQTILIQKIDLRRNEIISFKSFGDAKNFLIQKTEEFRLCQKLNGLYKTETSCFQYKIKQCEGACLNLENKADYNARVSRFVESHQFNLKNKIIIDRGRQNGEKVAILIQNNVVKGYTFFDLNFQLNNIEILENLITPLSHNRDAKRIVWSYLHKNNKRLKIIDL
jgi:DNA polymerase-3 subunit epsilon